MLILNLRRAYAGIEYIGYTQKYSMLKQVLQSLLLMDMWRGLVRAVCEVLKKAKNKHNLQKLRHLEVPFPVQTINCFDTNKEGSSGGP